MEKMSVDALLEIARIISKKAVSYEVSVEEELQLNGWLQRSEKNKQLFDTLLKQDDLVARMQLLERVDSGLAWEKVKKRLLARQFPLWRKQVLTFAKYAAVILLALALGFVTYWIWEGKGSGPMQAGCFGTGTIEPGSNKAFLQMSDGRLVALDDRDTLIEGSGIKILNEKKTLSFSSSGQDIASQPVLSCRLVTPVGGEYQVVLPDGTKVWLNAASELKYPSAFVGASREVELIGEAFFEVESNEKQPFIVKTARMHVQVTGTAFNVSSYPDDALAHTTLVEGKVNIDVASSNGVVRGYKLLPGMQVLVGDELPEGKSSYVDVAKYTAWRNGMFVFSNDPLDEILKKVSRWYGVEFVFADERLRQVAFTAEVKKFGSFSTLLDLIALGSGIRFTRTGERTISVSVAAGKVAL
ncbi:MAG: FecR domain-containing protein [Breznakibacter sp.]